MPPPLALTLTSIFVLFLLYLERKQNAAASHALWIPTLWMLLVMSKALGIWFGIGGSSMGEGSPLDKVFLSALLLIGLLILIKRDFNWTKGFKDNYWLMVLIGFMLVSVVWSDMPFISFKRWIRGGVVAIVMAFVVATENSPREALKSVFRRIIYFQIPVSIMLIKYFPHLGVEFHRWTGERMWIGVATQKNGLALRCLFALFFLFWTLARRWRGRDIPVVWYQTYIEVFIIMLALWLFAGPHHTLTYSSTSTAALAIGLIAFGGLKWLQGRNIIMGANVLSVLVSLVIIYGTVTPFLGGLTIFDASEFLGRDSSLTGRIDIWEKLIPYAMQKPFLGHGFGGFWTDEWREFIKASDAHNGYLDTILNIGFIGLILSSMFLINSCRKACREMRQDFDWGVFWFCIVLITLVHNIAESGIESITGLMPTVIFLTIVSRSKDPGIKNTS